MAKQKLRFTAKIDGKEAGVVAAITPPVDVPEFFGTRARVPIRGTINGYPFRSSLSPCGGRHMMPVNKMLCQGAGVQPGDIVEVEMERDDQERTVEAPPVLKKALAKSKAAQANSEKLSFTNKKEMAVSIIPFGAGCCYTFHPRLAPLRQAQGRRWAAFYRRFAAKTGITPDLLHVTWLLLSLETSRHEEHHENQVIGGAVSGIVCDFGRGPKRFSF